MVLSGLMVASVRADLPTDPEEYREWEARMLSSIAGKKEKADEESYLKLTGYICQLSLSTNREREGRPVSNAAREALISFPDHAAYLERLLEQAVQAEYAEARHQPRISAPFNQYQLFVAIKELRTPSCIALLGKLLEDDREPWKDKPEKDGDRPGANSTFAVSTLNALEIQGVSVMPLKSDRDFEAARNQWKLWFGEVKAGTRTFRFKGDPREYNLQGPVSAEALPAEKAK